MRFEQVPRQIIEAISGQEVRALIEKGITPLFLRGSGPTNDAERDHEQTALSYGLRQLEGQGGVKIDGLHRGSPILLREFALKALERNRRLLEVAANYRESAALKVEAMFYCGAFQALDPLQGPEIAPPQSLSPEPPQEPPALPQTEV